MDLSAIVMEQMSENEYFDIVPCFGIQVFYDQESARKVIHELVDFAVKREFTRETLAANGMDPPDPNN